jgi:hypothetical protein
VSVLEFQALCGDRSLDPGLVLEDLRLEVEAREIANDTGLLVAWMDARY